MNQRVVVGVLWMLAAAAGLVAWWVIEPTDPSAGVPGPMPLLPSAPAEGEGAGEPPFSSIHGSVRLLDERGQELSGPTGEFLLSDVRRGWHGRVDVARGEFASRIRLGPEVELGPLRIEGRYAQPIAEQREGERWSLAFQLVPLCTVEARCALTGEELPRIQFVPARRGRRPPAQDDSPAVSTPLLVAPPDVATAASDRVRYWMRAEGRAWQHIELRHARGGRRVVFLGAGSDLRVRVGRPSSSSPIRLRLRELPAEEAVLGPAVAALLQEPAERELWQDPSTGEFELRGLLPGRYLLSAEEDEWSADARRPVTTRVLGLESVELRPGRSAQVRLPLFD